jgi:holo-[acyl-carrier protein] synthase
MIIGTGFDVCDIRRIAQTLARFGTRFERRVFSDTEITKAHQRSVEGRHYPRAGTYAKRFAAKEACAKALGTGMARGVRWQDISIENQPGGKPELRLSGKAKARLQALCPKGYMPYLHVTLSDEYPHAYAQVIIEAVAVAD